MTIELAHEQAAEQAAKIEAAYREGWRDGYATGYNEGRHHVDDRRLDYSPPNADDDWAASNAAGEALKPCKVAELKANQKERCQCHIEAGDSPCDVHGEEFTLPRKALEVARFLLVMQVDHIDGKNNAVHYWPTTDDFRRALAAVEEALTQ